MEFQKYLLNISKFDTNRLRSKETLVSSILTESYSQVNKLKKEAWFALFEHTFVCVERGKQLIVYYYAYAREMSIWMYRKIKK